MTCQHEDFDATVKVARLSDKDDGPITGYNAEIMIKCAQCGAQFEFLGLEPGYDNQGARCSLDGKEALLAITPPGIKPNPFQRMACGVKGPFS